MAEFHSCEKQTITRTVVDQNVYINGISDHHSNQKVSRRILVLGYGSVGRCVLPLLQELLLGNLAPQSITVIDRVIPPPTILSWLNSSNITFEQKCIKEDSYEALLSNYLSAGDLLIDLLHSVSTEALVRWCHKNRVLYVNTTADVWFPSDTRNNLFDIYPFDFYEWHEKLIEVQYQLRLQCETKGATAIVEHGANPGLVSHCVKRGLQDMAHHVLHNGMIVDETRRQHVADALNKKDHARLSYLLGVKTIHISERDSQATTVPRKQNEVVNTWSTASLCEECICYAEFAWGTHEDEVPQGALIHDQFTQRWPPQRICLPRKSMNVWVSLAKYYSFINTSCKSLKVRSWVPSGPILGMAASHPESFSIAAYLTIPEEDSKKLLYQPSVYFVYLPCDSAICSLHEWRMQNYPLLDAQRIMCDDIVFGAEELGVLLLGGQEIAAWWTGSVLDIDETRRLVHGQSATTLQVAISAVAAVIYALRHPEEGVCFPEQIDTEQILDIAMPYLGTWVSRPVDCSITQTRHRMNGENKDCNSEWQFGAFLANL